MNAIILATDGSPAGEEADEIVADAGRRAAA